LPPKFSIQEVDMFVRVALGPCVLALTIAALLLPGCSSNTTTTKTDSQALASPPPSASRQGTKQPALAAAQGQAPSLSWDAHREGKTPASGPLKDILFAFDQAELSEEARATLRENAAWLRANPSTKVEIEGHCDERGATEYNIALGAKRSEAARGYLLTLGVPLARISTTSFGEELPVCKQKTEDCYQKNRRDRFVVLRAGPAL
jgi:peptidoglycan-associated lipoprotein